jgi:hypothetical protein
MRQDGLDALGNELLTKEKPIFLKLAHPVNKNKNQEKNPRGIDKSHRYNYNRIQNHRTDAILM